MSSDDPSHMVGTASSPPMKTPLPGHMVGTASSPSMKTPLPSHLVGTVSSPPMKTPLPSHLVGTASSPPMKTPLPGYLVTPTKKTLRPCQLPHASSIFSLILIGSIVYYTVLISTYQKQVDSRGLPAGHRLARVTPVPIGRVEHGMLPTNGSDVNVGERQCFQNFDSDKLGRVTFPNIMELSCVTSTCIPNIAMVVCGARYKEALVTMKSLAVLHSKSPVIFHIFTNKKHEVFTEVISKWPLYLNGCLSISFYPITYPCVDSNSWKAMFKECSTQRLFMPILLNHVDAVLYVDTDTIFLRPVQELWNLFNYFDSEQLASLAAAHKNSAYTNKKLCKFPVVPPYGLNSGVMLMNLTRMRQHHIVGDFISYYHGYKNRSRLTMPDQDILNIYFHFHRNHLYTLPCHWNYVDDFCKTNATHECETADMSGVSILHGSRGIFHNNNRLFFRAIYDAFQTHTFNQSLHVLATQIDSKLKVVKDSSYCRQLKHAFTQVLRTYPEQN